jgi:hypothetical protein
MRKRIALAITLGALMRTIWGSMLSSQDKPPDTSNQTEERIGRFRHDNFGMFIHWRPYSVLAGESKGQRVPVGTEAEWIMERFNMPGLRQNAILVLRCKKSRPKTAVSARRSGECGCILDTTGWLASGNRAGICFEFYA